MRPNFGILEDVDFSPYTTWVWFYFLKLENAVMHPHPMFMAEALLVLGLTGLALWYFNSERFLMNRALRGNLWALRRLAKRERKKRLHPDLKKEQKDILRAARRKEGWALYAIGTHLGDPESYIFRQNRPLSLLWIKKAAHLQDEQARGEVYGSAGSATRVHEEDDEKAGDPFKELRNMVGLEGVKKAVADITSRTQLFEKRRAANLPVSQPALHIVFLGNPGTGKTTVARILGRMLKKVGYLSRGHVVEVSEGELIGEYVGQTPIKVHRKIQQALGGILFIDEAYAMLNAGSDNASFSGSAIATLVKYMEDLRHDLVVIAAGYPKEMIEFLESNPGLKSRFTEVITFPDYEGRDLYKIYLRLCRSQKYKLDTVTKVRLAQMMEVATESFTRNFSNGRFVRNLFEDSIKYMAIRVSRKKETTREDLIMIYEEDIQNAFQDAIRSYGHRSEDRAAVGFALGGKD